MQQHPARHPGHHRRGCSRLFTGGLHCSGSRTHTSPRVSTCSRLSSAGSIAAMWLARTSASGRPGCSRRPTAGRVLRPSDGGLHCGLGTMGRTVVINEVLPPLSGGLHCGRSVFSSASVSNLRLPPFNGGLHCGPPNSQTCWRNSFVLPPINGGLHAATCWPGWTPGHPRAPAFYGGLYCGAVVVLMVIGWDRSAAGSIAAAP